MTLPDKSFLDNRNFCGGNFYSQITAGDHDSVGYFENIVKVDDTFTIFDFGNNIDALSIMPFKNMTNLLDVTWFSYKRCCNKVYFILNAEYNIVFVLLGQSRQMKFNSGNIDTLFVGYLPSVFDAAVYILILYFEDNKLNQAVVDKDFGVRLNIVRKFLIRGRKLFITAKYVINADNNSLAFDKNRFSALKRTGPDFWAFCIKKQGNGKMKFFPYPLNPVHSLLMFFVGSVREVESCNIHSFQHKSADNIIGIRSRTKSTDYLCFSHVHKHLLH